MTTSQDSPARIAPWSDDEATPLPQLRAAIAEAKALHVERPAPVAPRVAPVRSDFAAPYVRVTVTCGGCGERDALHGLTISRDARTFPACARCWREERQHAKVEGPPQTVQRQAARRFDERVMDCVERRPGATVIELCIDLELLPEGSERSRENRPITRRMDHALSRLRAARRVQKRRRGGSARFWPRAAPRTPVSVG